MIGPDVRVAHVGIAVNDVHEALGFYRDVLGLEPAAETTSDGAAIVAVQIGEVELEFMRPITHDGPVAKFLQSRGPGIHHISLQVPSIERALKECQRLGYRLIDEKPRPGAGGRQVAFVHPKATGGILLELTENP